MWQEKGEMIWAKKIKRWFFRCSAGLLARNDYEVEPSEATVPPPSALWQVTSINARERGRRSYRIHSWPHSPLFLLRPPTGLGSFCAAMTAAHSLTPYHHKGRRRGRRRIVKLPAMDQRVNIAVVQGVSDEKT